MMCKICKLRPSTGVIIQMCDPCFDDFEARSLAATIQGGSYEPSDAEVDSINPARAAEHGIHVRRGLPS